jgi:tetratricopeptide (TPR) repeat protein
MSEWGPENKLETNMHRGQFCALARRTVSAALFLPMSLPALAQFPEKFTNLQYFPKTITKQELLGMMRDFSLSLGAHCETCHVEKAEHKMDFASDDKEEKRTARVMLKMVDEINHGYIGKLGKKPAVQVQCVTCHRGIEKPQTIQAVLTETIEKKNVQAALAQYTELRKKYYGSASYDFSELPLDLMAESLAQNGKAKDAAAIMDMNVGFNPPTARTYNVLATVHKANGETDKAKEDLEKLLELQPDNRRAKQQLEELRNGKP